MDRMAGLALAGAGLAAGGLGMAAATGNLPVSKQQQLEELKAQGIEPTQEQEKEARDEQLAMWGTIALAMGGGLGLGIGGDQALSLGGDNDSPFWADGSVKSPPGGGGGGPWPRPGGGNRMAADPETVALAQQLAAASPSMAAEVEAIMARKAGVAPPVRAEATRYWAPATDLVENYTSIDLPSHWIDTRPGMLNAMSDIESSHQDAMGSDGYITEIARNSHGATPAEISGIAATVAQEFDDAENRAIGKHLLELETAPNDRTYLIPRNKNIPNDVELSIERPAFVDPSSLREIVDDGDDLLSLIELMSQKHARQARYDAGDIDTYWPPEAPFRPSRTSRGSHVNAYRGHQQGLNDWYWQEGLEGTVDLGGLSRGLYGAQPTYGTTSWGQKMRRWGMS